MGISGKGLRRRGTRGCPCGVQRAGPRAVLQQLSRLRNRQVEFLPLLREKYIVCACRNMWKGYNIEEARQLCEGMGIRFKKDPERHEVFPIDEY